MKNRYYVKKVIIFGYPCYIDWLVCDRNLKEAKNVICRASSRRKAYAISKALNVANNVTIVNKTLKHQVLIPPFTLHIMGNN
jgi:hypothetical protein